MKKKTSKRSKVAQHKPFVFETERAKLTVEIKPGQEVFVEIDNKLEKLDRNLIPIAEGGGEVFDMRFTGSVVTVRM